MSEGVKIALIVGGVAVGAYVIVKVTTPTGAAPRNTAPSSTNTSFISGIISAAGSIGSLFKGGSSSGSSTPNAPLTAIGVPGADTTAYDTSPDYNASSGDYGPFLPSSSLPSS